MCACENLFLIIAEYFKKAPWYFVCETNGITNKRDFTRSKIRCPAPQAQYCNRSSSALPVAKRRPVIYPILQAEIGERA